jgi:hypothetical protein
VKQKNVLLRAEHHRFQKDKHIKLGSLVRDYLDEHIASDTLDELPTRTEHRDAFESVRTSILLEQRHHEAIDAHNINLSQMIDNILSKRLERERKLSQLEQNMEGEQS